MMKMTQSAKSDGLFKGSKMQASISKSIEVIIGITMISFTL